MKMLDLRDYIKGNNKKEEGNFYNRSKFLSVVGDKLKFSDYTNRIDINGEKAAVYEDDALINTYKTIDTYDADKYKLRIIGKELVYWDDYTTEVKND